MPKAVFLDRDGVLNRERGDYTYRTEDFEVLPDVAETLKALKEKGYLLIVITNQGGIAKGLYSHTDFDRVQQKLEQTLQAAGVAIDDTYYCPHHPDHSRCLCRKPDSLLLEKAIARYRLDRAKCWFVGDRERDILAGEKVGIKTLRIESNSSLLRILEQI